MTIELSRADRAMMQGVIDIHLHAAPCLLDRPFDEVEIARQAREAGYAALVLKSIFVPNADRIEIVRQLVPDLPLFGGIVLNHTVGGVNPEAVAAAIGFGAKVVWLPTVHAANHIKYFGTARYPWQKQKGFDRKNEIKGIRLLDQRGELIPEMIEIIEIAHATRLIISTGHVASDEIFAVLRHADRIGYDKIVVTHVGWHATDWSDDDLLRMHDLPCTFEFTINPCMPARQQASPKIFAKRMLMLGTDRCVAATDLGQHDTGHPIDGFRMWLRILRENGLSDDDIDRAARRNPARLLDLQAPAPVATGEARSGAAA
jgi:Family of unknown function (DUF6282)